MLEDRLKLRLLVKRVKREDMAKEAHVVGTAMGRAEMCLKGVEVREGEGSWTVWAAAVREGEHIWGIAHSGLQV